MIGFEPSTAVVEVWRHIIVGEGKSWVLFEQGTCVIFRDLRAGHADAAIALLREWGPVHAGSSAGDFSVIELTDEPGWVVTCHHPDVLTYVSPGALSAVPSELEVGMAGRSQRDQDAEDLKVIHVEG